MECDVGGWMDDMSGIGGEGGKNRRWKSRVDIQIIRKVVHQVPIRHGPLALLVFLSQPGQEIRSVVLRSGFIAAIPFITVIILNTFLRELEIRSLGSQKKITNPYLSIHREPTT